ncbi:MAG TPA: TM0106 family RecB-like putative nuclease [Amnibacterium sp.]|nr:TM0106 family RecB-like putative nuclease [Amnibacterium sp.]
MFVRNGTVVCSASDLKASVECEWGLMRRLDAKLGRVEAVPEPEDSMNRRAAALGDDHERRQLEEYLATFGAHVPGRPGGVAVIERPDDSTDFAALRAAQELTLAAMRDGADVVFQATLFDGSFLGFADFLVRSSTEGGVRWEVYDTKLARRAKVTALLQLAAYAQQLDRLGIPVGDTVHLLLGDGTRSSHRLEDVRPVFDLRMARLRQLVGDRTADRAAIEWGAEGVRACGRCAECTAQAEATRDVLLVGRLTVNQRVRLREVGIRTIDEFAASTGPIEGIGPAALQRLRLQAELQLRAEATADTGRHRVEVQVIDPDGFAALPPADPGDIFFDFEGDPLWSDDNREWGLEYLFGVIDHDGRREHFRPFWAHDRAEEKQALLDFLHSVRDRRQRYPDLHIYHYADYERSHLQQLCARHGVGEAILDDLLRDHVLVDLYPIVLRTIRISDRSYSLKKLEPIYMGDRLRESDVTSAAASVDAYVVYCRLRDEGRSAEAEAQLREIADYNEYDCASTLGLRDWLLARADELGIRRRPPLPGDPAKDTQLARREDLARDALLATVSGVAADARTPEQTALALAAAAIEYHRREDKSFWWEHYNREIAPVEAWAEQKDVLVVDADASSVLQDWARQGKRQSDSRVLRLVGALAPGSSLKRGDRCFVMYDDPPPVGCDAVPEGQRGEHSGGEVLEVRQLPDGRVSVDLDEVAGRDDAGVACAPWPELPLALTPGPPFNTRTQREAILEWGEALVAAPDRRDATLDLLRREPPRLAGGGPLAPAPASVTDAIVSSALRLDRSYLAVQGPPGSGKTHLGAQVIATLVREHGWRVGVVAQSHAVVENLLDRVLAAGLDPAIVAKRTASNGGSGPWTPLESKDVLPFVRQHRPEGYVLGGTAWVFSNRNQVPRDELDLLVVDEAGQYSLANTIAVGVSARNVLLLGDPQQLPQVSQGLHPEPVDRSALGWLSDGHDVLPGELGYFLAETWRMHPALTEAVSDLSYEGRLGSHVPETTDRRLVGVQPGLEPVPIEHVGDSVESVAEADAVVGLVRSHLGRLWTDPSAGRVDEPLDQPDLIVVAPFNAQVALLRERLDAAGYPRVPVGTVDKFQGQEAVIAIVSLTASSPADVPRGISFVMMRNRLNVAISRAKWASHLVHSPALADHLPHTAEGVAELSGFLRLTRGG